MDMRTSGPTQPATANAAATATSTDAAATTAAAPASDQWTDYFMCLGDRVQPGHVHVHLMSNATT